MKAQSQTTPLRLAILDADRLHEPLRDRYHSYASMFERLLRDAGVDWLMDTYLVIDGQYPQQRTSYDAFLITGSKYDSFADTPWIAGLRDYVRDCHADHQPLVGICFGHQLLAHALGGEAGRCDAGWGLGVMQYGLLADAPFVDGPAAVNMIVSHQDQVRRLPPRATRLLGNDFCANAGFYIDNEVLALQGHPEFTPDYANALLDYRAETLPADVVGAARQSLDLPHDGARVARWIRQFVEAAAAPRQ